MAAILKVISLVSGIIGITTFIASELPKDTKGQMDSTVRIAVGLNNKKGLENADGTSPMVLAFNEFGEHIGHSHWDEAGHISTGSYKDITIHQDAGPGQQATTLQVCALNDAVCVAYISQTWSDGANRGWLGDMARECGQPWYYSNIIVGDQGYKPSCAWIDQDHTNDIKTSAMQIHMQDFAKLSDDSKIVEDPQYYCRQPAMLFKHLHNYKFYEEWKQWWGKDHKNQNQNYDHRAQGIYNMAKGAKPWEYTLWTGPEEHEVSPRVQRRTARQRRQENAFEHLITSTHQDHNATVLCESEGSRGPDFVSLHEGLFCDMSTGTVWPLCEQGDDDDAMRDCFHLERQRVIHAGRRILAEMAAEGKKYSHVEEWK